MKPKTDQRSKPITNKEPSVDSYDINPSHPIINGTIEIGYDTLAQRISGEGTVLLDGYVGVDWEQVISALVSCLERDGLSVATFDIRNCLKSESDIKAMVEPFLGGDDPVFGHRTTLKLKDYFNQEEINAIEVDHIADVRLIYGTGAHQSNIDGLLVYFDVPKNELKSRSSTGAIANLGFDKAKSPQKMYKHFYFVDWIVLNKEKKELLPKMAIIVDQQRPLEPTWMEGPVLRSNLTRLSKSYFRVRPWFEPGVWGGQWMKERFSGLDPDVPNYAWSFEMIVPENGLVFEDRGTLLEVSFDVLMFHERENVLGKAAKRFKDEFPIRFDFLDTFQGGNLSVQCHPNSDYIKENFGENFTQDETYYILDSTDNAKVYLGFQETIDPKEFKKALRHSDETGEEVHIEKYVMTYPAKKHDLFLIPHGTIHCSGKDTMVLEISATPYIFTFKMYDWQRLDLDGKPRPINVKRAFDNLDFERKGYVVEETLISKPVLEASGDTWKKVHLPTHPDHFYDIYRYEFEGEVRIETLGQCHILMLVEGTSIALELEGAFKTFHYAETFAVPAATNRYKLLNTGKKMAKVVVAFVREDAC
ncbi:MAG TPA: class I mannose-6-phosphate isomerase [Pricia sp.]|nr:class I mannose-6-phosphate isomerase [Pricia sp.]